MEESVDCIMKIVLIGDSAVGKTNILLRYTKDDFHSHTKPTIGTDFASKVINLNGLTVKVQFWDTAGQEKYKSLSSSYYREAHGVILIYDITKRETFEHCDRWLSDLEANATGSYEVLLVGNKLDLVSKRQVLKEEAENFAKARKMKFMEVSAKENKNDCVKKAFEAILNDSIEKMSFYKQTMQIDKNKSQDSGRRVDVRRGRREEGNNDRGCC